MKKINAIYIFFILIMPISSISQTSELIELSQIMEQQDLQVESWTVTVKEQLTSEQATEKLKVFSEGYIIKELKDKKTLKYIITNKEQAEGFSVSFTVIIPKEKQYYAELIMVIEGEQLTNKSVKEYQQQIQFLQKEHFTKREKVFTCLTATNNAIITSDDFLKELSKKLELKHVSTQTESIKEALDKEIIYGYTTFWNNKIMLEDEPLNIQVVIQNDESMKQKIIIGTPILITEY